MNKKHIKLSWVWTLFLILTACYQQHETKHQFFVFGTVVEISIWHNNSDTAQTAINAINQKFNQMHHQWHAWKPGRLNQINQSLRHGKTVRLETDEAQFIQHTIELAKKSNHLFNPTIGELINLWGFHSDEYPLLTPPPSKSTIDQLVKQNISVDDLILDDLQLSSTKPQMWLDFGGIAKGYAVDIAIDILQNHGINNAIINAGGDIRSIGNKPDKPWRVAIQSPKDWSMLAEIQAKNSEAIFTSGNYQRYKEFDGKRYAHIINPRTGLPVDQVVSATVIAQNGVLADTAATALVVAGDNWLKIAHQLGIYQALIIDEHHQCFATKKMFNRLENLNIECVVVN